MPGGRLNGKVALVTGATSGIGGCIAEGFAREGAQVVLCGRREDEGEALAAGIRSSGGEALFVRCDVSDGPQVERLVARAVDAFGALDIAVNNAGMGASGARLADLDEAEFDAVLATNLRGVWLCMKHEIRAMLAAGHGGSIINMGSVLGHTAFPHGSQFSAAHYSAAKHGIEALTKSGAMDYGRDGIRVNTIAPGIVETPITQAASSDEWPMGRLWQDATALGRFAVVDEIVGAAVFLASDEASYCTGSSLVIDGGYLAQ